MENGYPIFLANICSFFQISFSELKDSKEKFIFMEKNKNRRFPIFVVHGNLKLIDKGERIVLNYE